MLMVSNQPGFKVFYFALEVPIFPAHLILTNGSHPPVSSAGGNPRPWYSCTRKSYSYRSCINFSCCCSVKSTLSDFGLNFNKDTFTIKKPANSSSFTKSRDLSSFNSTKIVSWSISQLNSVWVLKIFEALFRQKKKKKQKFSKQSIPRFFKIKIL